MAAKIIDTRTLVDPVEVTLKAAGQEPRNETITALEVREFKGRDMRALDGLADTQAGSIALALAARITRQPIQVIEELGKADFVWLFEFVQDFLPSGPPTGGTSSET